MTPVFLSPASASRNSKVINDANVKPKLLRLFQNLIDNTLKYRIHGRKTEISVLAQIAGSEWHLEIRDNGIGLLPGQEARSCKVFERLQPRSRYLGIGIGLTLCRKIAEHHKGRIWVESAGKNQDCTFFVRLPLHISLQAGDSKSKNAGLLNQSGADI